MKRLTLLAVLLAPLLCLAQPRCLPKQAGGTGTKAISAPVPQGQATWWWCPAGVSSNGFQLWAHEWYGWESEREVDIDVNFDLQSFRVDNAESVRQAWQASRFYDFRTSQFPTNVLVTAAPTRPVSVKVK